LDHADFDWGNPNKLRALVGQFANNNLVNFHREDGAGYQLLADVVAELDTRNPQVAARLITPLTRWRNYRSGGELMSAQLQRLADAPKLSKDLYEVVSKSL
jgi:aminopeptidase N